MTATSIFRRGGSGPYQLTNFERSQTSGCSIIDSLFACVAFQAGFSPFPLRWLRVLRILLIVPYITSLLVVSALFSLASAVALDLVLPPLLPALTTFSLRATLPISSPFRLAERLPFLLWTVISFHRLSKGRAFF